MKNEFKTVTETYFRSATECLDFNKSVEAAKIINNWCEINTNNRIKDIIQSGNNFYLSGKNSALIILYF